MLLVAERVELVRAGLPEVDRDRVGRLTVGRRRVGEDHAAGSSHDSPTGTVPGGKELAMAGSQQGPDDVEGHRVIQDTEAADEAPTATDVEGHRVVQDTEAIDEDDAEGHSWR